MTTVYHNQEETASTTSQEKHVLMLPVAILRVDHTYQRPLDEKHVKNLVTRFDKRLLDNLLVNVRKDGSTYVVDGQHRLEMLIRLGMSEAPCTLYHGLSVAKEAELFTKKNNGQSKRMNSIDRLTALLVANDATAIAIHATVRNAGYEIAQRTSDYSGPDTINAVRALMDIWQKGGEPLLAMTLRIVSNAWIAERRRVEWDVLKSVANFCCKYAEKFDENRLVTRLAKVGLAQIMAQGNMLASANHIATWAGATIAMQRAYDHSLTVNRLEPKED